MKPEITVVGSSNTDMIIKVDRIPRPGETILGGEFLTAAGGKGANQAVGAARAGGAVTFIARVGTDVFGNEAIEGFKKTGIRVHYVGRDPKLASGVALIFVSRDGENSIAVASGANHALLPAHVKKARQAIATAQVLVLQLETPLRTVAAAAQIGRAAGAKVILNPAPAQELPDALLRNVSILTPNETEAQLLTGVVVRNQTSAAKAARRLRSRGVDTVIVTLGSGGAYVASGEGEGLVPAFKVKPLDTTAAGDIFNGALAVALGEGKPLEEAVRFANAAAAISVTRMGAQPSAPGRKEIEQFLKRHS